MVGAINWHLRSLGSKNYNIYGIEWLSVGASNALKKADERKTVELLNN